MRHAVNHTLISGAALAVVVAGLVLLDPRVRRSFADLAAPTAAPTLARVASGVHDIGTTVVTAVLDQSIANAPLMIFVVIATVLTLFMVRT